MNQSISDRIREAKGKLAREFTIADSYEMEKDLTVLKCRGISLKLIDLIAEALEEKPEPAPASESIEVGDEVWISATIFSSLDGNNVGVRVPDMNGTGWGIRISKKLIRKKESR